MGADRRALAGIVGQVAVGIVLEQRHAKIVAGAGQRGALVGIVAMPGRILESRDGVSKGRQAGRIETGLGPARVERRETGAEIAEDLQGGQVGG